MSNRKDHDGARVLKVDGTHFPNNYKVEKGNTESLAQQQEKALEQQKKELQEKLKKETQEKQKLQAEKAAQEKKK